MTTRRGFITSAAAVAAVPIVVADTDVTTPMTIDRCRSARRKARPKFFIDLFQALVHATWQQKSLVENL